MSLFSFICGSWVIRCGFEVERGIVSRIRLGTGVVRVSVGIETLARDVGGQMSSGPLEFTDGGWSSRPDRGGWNRWRRPLPARATVPLLVRFSKGTRRSDSKNRGSTALGTVAGCTTVVRSPSVTLLRDSFHRTQTYNTNSDFATLRL